MEISEGREGMTFRTARLAAACLRRTGRQMSSIGADAEVWFRHADITRPTVTHFVQILDQSQRNLAQIRKRMYEDSRGCFLTMVRSGEIE
jgi:hypothetical protein